MTACIGGDRRRAAARIAFEQDRRAGVVDRSAVGQHGGERLGVAEAQVDALAGQRMDAVRRVADEREPMGDDRGQAQELERERSPAA